MTELFPVEQVTSLSPRLRWMRNHKVKTGKNPHCTYDDPEPWEAYITDRISAINYALECQEEGGDYSRNDCYCTGKTEHDAIVNLAEENRWPLWNEEGA